MYFLRLKSVWFGPLCKKKMWRRRQTIGWGVQRDLCQLNFRLIGTQLLPVGQRKLLHRLEKEDRPIRICTECTAGFAPWQASFMIAINEISGVVVGCLHTKVNNLEIALNHLNVQIIHARETQWISIHEICSWKNAMVSTIKLKTLPNQHNQYLKGSM